MLVDTLKQSADSITISAAGAVIQVTDVPVEMKWVAIVVPLAYVLWRWVTNVIDRRKRMRWYEDHPTIDPTPANPKGLDNSQE